MNSFPISIRFKTIEDWLGTTAISHLEIRIIPNDNNFRIVLKEISISYEKLNCTEHTDKVMNNAYREKVPSIREIFNCFGLDIQTVIRGSFTVNGVKI